MKPLLTFLLLLFISKSYAQEYDLDSLVKTHKKVAILPVRVMYAFKKMPDEKTLNDIERKQFDDSFVLQEQLYNLLLKEKENVLVDLQSFNETDSLLAENEVTLYDLKDLPANFLCEILKVDGIIECEIKFSDSIDDSKNRTNHQISRLAAITSFFVFTNPINSHLISTAGKVRNASIIKDPYFKNKKEIKQYSDMTFLDGKTNEVIWDYSTELSDKRFKNVSDVIERVLLTNFKKSPYYKK